MSETGEQEVGPDDLTAGGFRPWVQYVYLAAEVHARLQDGDFLTDGVQRLRDRMAELMPAMSEVERRTCHGVNVLLHDIDARASAERSEALRVKP